MSPGPEHDLVEQPFIDQLISMGWKYTTGNASEPSATGRESSREVLLREELRRGIERINLDDDGRPWVDEGRVNQALSALERIGPPQKGTLNLGCMYKKVGTYENENGSFILEVKEATS